VGNTQGIAQEINPDARVVYIDNDPAVLAHGRALLTTDKNTVVVAGDMGRPIDVLEHPETLDLIDFSQPVGVLMIAMVHFLTLEERPKVMGQLYENLVPGSYFAAIAATSENKPRPVVEQIESVYKDTPTPIYFRSRAEIALFFDGYDLVDPGLVTLDAWRPDPQDPGPEPTYWGYGAVGRKT
jgi:hypothetical protein